MLKFKERMRSIIKPFQNHNRIKNGAIFTANIPERNRVERIQNRISYMRNVLENGLVFNMKIARNGI